MKAETFLEMAGIPLLIFVICMYYGIRLVISKDISMIRGKGKAPVRDEKEYLEGAAKLMFFLGVNGSARVCQSVRGNGGNYNKYIHYGNTLETAGNEIRIIITVGI